MFSDDRDLGRDHGESSHGRGGGGDGGDDGTYEAQLFLHRITFYCRLENVQDENASRYPEANSLKRRDLRARTCPKVIVVTV